MQEISLFERLESNVRSYCRSFPTVFSKAKNSKIFDLDGKEYIDFLSGAGALNYGHNNEYIKSAILKYISDDGLMHGLDMYTQAKYEFLDVFENKILKPRQLDYKVQFCGSTGTNAVEAAFKLARKVKKRTNIISFMGGFHGMTMGSLSATAGLESRSGAGVPLGNVTFMPFPSQEFEDINTLSYLKRVLSDDHSGIDKPAAIIVETTQAEGGINVAPSQWLKDLSVICKENDILLICDDIQVGCGRTGNFFSFERAGIIPDIVVLSKSISGYGFPMSILLFKPELDIWAPGEHNGTFRGNQIAFVAAKAAIDFRDENNLDKAVREKGKIVKEFIEKEILIFHRGLKLRGLGLIWGIDCAALGSGFAKQICRESFKRGLILERAGREDCVLKILPPLTIDAEDLRKGLNIIKDSFALAFSSDKAYAYGIKPVFSALDSISPRKN